MILIKLLDKLYIVFISYSFYEGLVGIHLDYYGCIGNKTIRLINYSSFRCFMTEMGGLGSTGIQ